MHLVVKVYYAYNTLLSHLGREQQNTDQNVFVQIDFFLFKRRGINILKDFENASLYIGYHFA